MVFPLAGMRRVIFRLFFMSFFLLLVGPVAWGASLEQARIDIPPVIYMPDGAFSLGEAARIEAGARVKEALSALLLFPSNGVLSREQVLRAVKGSGLEGLRVELRMPNQVRVDPPALEGNGTDPAPAPVGEPTENPQKRADVSLASMIKSLAAWDGEVEVSHAGAVPPGRVVSPASIVPGTPAATLRFQDDKGRVRSLGVRLVWIQEVQVAARTIQRNIPIVPQDLMTRSMRISRPGVYAARPEEVLGHISRRALKQGEPILLELLSGTAQIKKGRKVRILARSGGLTAAAEGVLLDDGLPGELVRVRRSDRKKVILKAYLLDENTVEVRIP